MRTSRQEPERMWILEAWKPRQKAQYRDELLGLRYQIPQTRYEPEKQHDPSLVMTNAQAKNLFSEFGLTGHHLLKDHNLQFDYPTYVPKASCSKRRTGINLTMCASKRKSQSGCPQLTVESHYGYEPVKHLAGVIKNGNYWRLRKTSYGYKVLLKLAKEIEAELKRANLSPTIAYKAKFLAHGTMPGTFLTLPAAGLNPGLIVPIVNDNGSMIFDTITYIQHQENVSSTPFYDLEAEHTHNIISAGVDTHNAMNGFRGSMIDSRRGFLKSFPQAHIFRLAQHYRSTKQILNVANHILQDAKGLIPKKLFTSKEDGSQPELVTCESELAQSQFIATRILELMNQGVSIKEMAVLFRSSSHSFELEASLTKHRLHFVKYGGLQLTETARVKDVLAYLRVADNPLDAGAWHRLLLRIDRVEAKFAQRLIESMEAHPHPLDVLEQAEGKQQRALSNLASVIRSVQDETIPLMGRMNLVLHHYEPLLRRDYGTEAEHRMDDLKKLAELAGHNPSLEVFLQDITLDPNQSKDGSRDQKDVHLTLSTIHSAKGLEWKVVFVIWLLDGQFPPVRSWYEEPVLEEERRLFYVAVTRAKDQLTMWYPVEHYHHGVQQILTQPCRFIRSIPQPTLTALHAAEVR